MRMKVVPLTGVNAMGPKEVNAVVPVGKAVELDAMIAVPGSVTAPFPSVLSVVRDDESTYTARPRGLLGVFFRAALNANVALENVDVSTANSTYSSFAKTSVVPVVMSPFDPQEFAPSANEVDAMPSPGFADAVTFAVV